MHNIRPVRDRSKRVINAPDLGKSRDATITAKTTLQKKNAYDKQSKAEREKQDVEGYLNKLDRQRYYRYAHIKKK